MLTRHDGRPTPYPKSAAAGRADFDIMRDVQAILADPARSPRGSDIVTAVREGVVTLRGTILRPQDRAAIRRVVGRVPGVLAVGCDLRPGERAPAHI